MADPIQDHGVSDGSSERSPLIRNASTMGVYGSSPGSSSSSSSDSSASIASKRSRGSDEETGIMKSPADDRLSQNAMLRIVLPMLLGKSFCVIIVRSS